MPQSPQQNAEGLHARLKKMQRRVASLVTKGTNDGTTPSKSQATDQPDTHDSNDAQSIALSTPEAGKKASLSGTTIPAADAEIASRSDSGPLSKATTPPPPHNEQIPAPVIYRDRPPVVCRKAPLKSIPCSAAPARGPCWRGDACPYGHDMVVALPGDPDFQPGTAHAGKQQESPRGADNSHEESPSQGGARAAAIAAPAGRGPTVSEDT